MSLSYQSEDETLPEAEGDVDVDVDVPLPPPRPVYTVALIGSLLVVAAIQFSTGLENSIIAAGFDKPAFTAGEYWRILTGATVHGSLLHVIMNCYAFYSFGRIFEMLSNRSQLAIVFLASAIGGGILSLVFAPDGLSVGASGGIVGIIGYLAVYAFRRRQFISHEFRRSLLINIAFILVFGLVLFQVIDNYGHIGGLITGAFYGLAQVNGDPHVDPRDAGPLATGAGLASLAVFIAGCGFSILLILRLV